MELHFREASNTYKDVTYGKSCISKNSGFSQTLKYRHNLKNFTMSTSANQTKPHIPLAGIASDGWSKEGEATATCFCGAVQLAFVSTSETLL